MIFSKRNQRTDSWLLGCAAAGAAAMIFIRPAAAANGVLEGLSLCYRAVIPALFPFLVFSRLLLESRAANAAGLLLRPYTRLLRVKSAKAPAALLCGILGGFACGAKAVDTQYRAGEIDRDEAALLLVCSIGSGPGFVVGSVGTLLLGNTGVGWLLLGAQLGASLLCGLAASLLFRAIKSGRRCNQTGSVKRDAPKIGKKPPALSGSGETGFVPAVREAVNATVMLCGYVTLFSFFTAVAVPDGATATARFWAALPLELTSACRAICESASAMRTQLCCAALSVMGASVVFQVRALVSPEISLRPLLLSRLAHVPLALLLLRFLSSLFPTAVAAGMTADPRVLPAIRMPYDAMLALFLLAAVCGASPSLQRKKKEI